MKTILQIIIYAIVAMLLSISVITAAKKTHGVIESALAAIIIAELTILIYLIAKTLILMI